MLSGSQTPVCQCRQVERTRTESEDFSFLCSDLQTSDPTHASECREEARTRMADRGDVGISDTRTQHTDCVH